MNLVKIVLNAVFGLYNQDFLLVCWANSQSHTGIWQFFPQSGVWQVLPLSNVYNPTAVGYDPVDEKVYWSDGIVRWLAYANIDGSGQGYSFLYKQGVAIDGLYVEPHSRLLYYTCTDGGKVIVRHLETGQQHIITSVSGDQPRDIAVDFVNRMVYWTNWGERLKGVKESTLDGSGMDILYFDSSFNYTNGLHIDLHRTPRTAYVCDNSVISDVVWETNYISFDVASGKEKQHSSSFNGQCYHLEGSNSQLFIADWQKGLLVSQLDQPRTATLVKGQPQTGRPQGLFYHHADFKKQPNPCSEGGGCSVDEFCIPTRNGTTCVEDEDTGIGPESQTTSTPSSTSTPSLAQDLPKEEL